MQTACRDGRERIAGILQFANEHASWHVDLAITRCGIETCLNDISKLSTYDGMIVAANEDIKIDRKKLQCYPPNLSIVSGIVKFKSFARSRAVLADNRSIGREAARYCRTLGHFASFAFYHGNSKTTWSAERMKSFAEELGQDVSEIDANVASPEGMLIALPKPTFVFAAYDGCARQVIRACQDRGLRVPDDVVVLGCDNDDIYCEGIRPRISSIEPNFREIGYVAAQTLDRLMRGQAQSIPSVRYISSVKIVERESTLPIPPAASLIERAERFIEANACRGISVRDVANAIGTSRSLLDLRFRELRKQSVLQHIIDLRLKTLCNLLRRSDMPITKLGRECGFNDPDNLKRLFKKRMGVSMREFRGTVP